MHAADHHGTPAQIRRAIWATRGLFTVLGVFSAVWGVHIPSVKRQYDLGEAALSLVLVAAALGAIAALFFAGRVIGRLGARNAAAACAVVMAAMLSMVLHWPGLPWVLASMLVFGASLSVYDVAINTEGSVLETAGGRPIMGSLHGMFSVGAMGGGRVGGAVHSDGLALDAAHADAQHPAQSALHLAAWRLAHHGLAHLCRHECRGCDV